MEFHGTDTSSSMELHGAWSVPISRTRAVPGNSMELGMRQFRWHEQFQGIPWNFKCANFTDTSISMEFHGTWSAPISMTRAVPWNSMELGVRQFRWHKKFHGNSWNLEIWSASISLTRAAPWNSMEFNGTWSAPIPLQKQFHGIPWNLECANFADMSSSMEFHGTSSAPISLTRAVPWNSMELGVCQFRWQEQFHGIPWNFKCANFADTICSMEFHGTSSAPISLTLAVPWNSMELRWRQFRWHEQFHGIPWNFKCANFAGTSSSMKFHGVP